MAELSEDIVTRCVVRRGAFVIPAGLLEEGYDYELARFIAQRMPDGPKRASATWEKPDEHGDVRVRWRLVDVVRVR